MKDLLLHVCCAPCSTYSVKFFQDIGFHVTGFFFNPNIQPYREFKKRAQTLLDYFKKNNIPLSFNDSYLLEDFLEKVPYYRPDRCHMCYKWRLEETAAEAKDKGYDYFSTTLLISPYQEQGSIKRIGFEVQEKTNIKFVYKDIRDGFKKSIEMARNADLYRQNYCGCIFSEKERFLKSKS